MKIRPYLLHALSPLHAGTGQGVDVLDLPIARMQSSGIPIVPGSSIKGVLRDARIDQSEEEGSINKKEMKTVFGPWTDKADEFAGALMVSDARLLALPVRSFFGTFAWISSPLLLHLARRDLEGLPDAPKELPIFEKGRRTREAKVASTDGCLNVYKAKVYLEDLDLPAHKDASVDAWGAFLAPFVCKEDKELFTSRFVIVDDETMSFLWETATQVDTRIRLDPTTRTVAQGALWTEESLPPESILIGVLIGQRGRRRDSTLDAEQVLEKALSKEEVLQFGGKATVGRGRCRILPVKGGVA